MKTLIWLHEDALRCDHPVFQAAGEDNHACYIWDADYLQTMEYGFKRLCFIYEALCELPVTIYQGQTVLVINELATTMQTDQLLIPATPNPEIHSIIAELSEQLHSVIIDDIPFIHPKSNPDTKRFFRYWNKTKKLAMQANGGKA